MTPDVSSRPAHLVLFPGALGDAVCLEPAIAWLARSGPVTIHARGAAAEVAALFPARPRVRSLDAIELARLFSPEHDDRTDSWLAGYARIVSFTGAGVPQVAKRLAATGRAVCAAFPRPPLAVHATDYFLRVASGDPVASAPEPRLELAGRAAPAGRVLVLLPGSGGRDKRGPAALFATLAARWRAAGGDVHVVLGPAEEGEDDAWREVGSVLRPAGIVSLASHLATASAFAGNDTGPSHAAAALGVPGSCSTRRRCRRSSVRAAARCTRYRSRVPRRRSVADPAVTGHDDGGPCCAVVTLTSHRGGTTHRRYGSFAAGSRRARSAGSQSVLARRRSTSCTSSRCYLSSSRRWAGRRFP